MSLGEGSLDSSSRWTCFRRDSLMVIVDVGGPHVPAIVYWGCDLGELSEDEIVSLPLAARLVRGERSSDRGSVFSLSPTRADGWPGWPGLRGHRAGHCTQPLFGLDRVTTLQSDVGDVLNYRAMDSTAQLSLDGELVLTVDGVLKHRQTLTSTASAAEPGYEVEDLLTLLPVPEDVVDVLDFTGRWANEAQAQRHPMSQGIWLREQRRGRTGPDTPLVMFAGTDGFRARHGEVWGVHLGWSGDQRYLVQRLNTGTTLMGAGEILAAGEVILGPGDAVTTPWVYAVYSDRGIDGATARLHSMLRRRPGHPKNPRPVMLNIWEAVTFDQSFERVAKLADIAAEIGVERLVIDDGWFGSRRDATSGLGDWYVSRDVWPDGLGPIADHVRSLGMQFGLWFEPEMVNPDSDLARAHPDWVMGTAGRVPPTGRNQQVLDVSHPGAFEYVLERMSSLVSECGIDYIKWDHNRDLADPVHRSGPGAGRPAVREQTLATYRIMDELRRRHPSLEIESCAGGGSRIDLGILERTDRVWASDCIDPIERSRIVPGLATLLPLELIGSHVASGRSHTTGRRHDLPLRLGVALFGHQGFEWDLTETTGQEREWLAQWVALVKSLRPLVHTGELVRPDRPSDPGTTLYGVVAQDRSEALFILLRSYTDPEWEPAPLRFDGLDPARRYKLTRVSLPGEPALAADDPRRLVSLDNPIVPGSLLMGAGVVAPYLQPEEAALFHLTTHKQARRT